MAMLTQEDLKQIGALLVENNKVFKTELVDEIVGQVGEMIESNVLPRFDEMEAKIAALPTKEYIDEKLGTLRADFNLSQRGAVI